MDQQVRRDTAGAACDAINAMLGEAEEAERRVGQLRAALNMLLDAVGELDDDARTGFPETAVVAAVTALAQE